MKEWVERLKNKPWVAHLLRAVERFNNRLGSQFGAAITYFSILALVPILLFAFAVLGFVLTVLRPDLIDDVVDAVRRRPRRHRRSGDPAAAGHAGQRHAEQLARGGHRGPADGDLLRRRLDGQPEERRPRPVAARLRYAGEPGQYRQEDGDQPGHPGRPDRADRGHVRPGVGLDRAGRRTCSAGSASIEIGWLSRCSGSCRSSSPSARAGCCSCTCSPCCPRSVSPGRSSAVAR